MRKIEGRLSAEDLWKEFVARLEAANDERVSEADHLVRVEALRQWRAGVMHGSGITFNGDLHYAGSQDPVKQAIWNHRPMCSGLILDWGINSEVEELIVQLDNATGAKKDG